MHYDDNIHAQLVHDYETTAAPVRMGTPKADQLQGTALEQLAELAGRVCYDSLGQGRSSADYHQHILEVGHLSVYEHCNWTLAIAAHDAQSNFARYAQLERLYPMLLGRPGVWCRTEEQGEAVRLFVTLNMRSALEWDDWHPCVRQDPNCADALRQMVRASAFQMMPQVMDEHTATGWNEHGYTYAIVRPQHPEEKWVSLLVGGSRGMSHELVRHGDRTAISQRSTRYVDESDSPWVEHPLVTGGLHNSTLDGTRHPAWRRADTCRMEAQVAYTTLYEALEAEQIGRGVAKGVARKQARGAARGVLGNGLYTELIFSASVAQWHRMIAQRATPHADAEIRVLFERIVNALRTSCWPLDFEYAWQDSPDGIGKVLA